MKKIMAYCLIFLIPLVFFVVDFAKADKEQASPYLRNVKMCYEGIPCVRVIDPEFYGKNLSFYIFTLINTTECKEIEDAAKNYLEDVALHDYLAYHLYVCEYEVSNGLRFEEQQYHVAPWMYDLEYMDLYPDDTVFVEPKEYA